MLELANIRAYYKMDWMISMKNAKKNSNQFIDYNLCAFLNHGRLYLLDDNEAMQEILQDAGLLKLIDILIVIKNKKGANITNKEIDNFLTKLREEMQNHRDIAHKWLLSKTKIDKFGQYIHATNLISDCLNVAEYFTNREEFKNSLLVLQI